MTGALEQSDKEWCDDIGIAVTSEVGYLNLAIQSEMASKSTIASADAYIPEGEYVEQRLTPGNRPWSRYLTDWLATSDGGLLIVLGHAGYGKTCLAHQLGRKLAKEHLEEPLKPVPFVLPLHKHRYVRRFEELVLTHLQDRGILGFTSKAFAFLANNNRVVAILDGFDELAETGGIRVARETLKGLIEQLTSNAKVILTSREAYFRHRGDLSMYGDPNGFLSGLQTLELQPFDAAERKAFLEKRGLSTQQVRDVEKVVQGLAAEELLGSPLMLKILSDEVRQGEKFVGSTATDVFERSLAKICERELPKQKISWDTPKQLEFLAGLADLMNEEQTYELVDSDAWLSLVVDSDVPSDLASTKKKNELLARVTQLKNHPLLNAFTVGEKDAISFPHPLYKDYFVARKFKLASNHEHELRYLVRAGLPEGSITFVAQMVGESDLAAIALKCLQWKEGVRDVWRISLVKCDIASRDNIKTRTEKLVACFGGKTQFDYQNLSGLNFRLLQFNSFSFVGTNFTSSSFQGCNFQNCAFHGSQLGGCRFYDCEADQETAKVLNALGVQTVTIPRRLRTPKVILTSREEDPVRELVTRVFRRFIREARGRHQRTVKQNSFFSGLGGEERKFTHREIIPAMLSAHVMEPLEAGVDVYEFNSDWQTHGDALIWDNRVSDKMGPILEKLQAKARRYNLL